MFRFGDWLDRILVFVFLGGTAGRLVYLLATGGDIRVLNLLSFGLLAVGLFFLVAFVVVGIANLRRLRLVRPRVVVWDAGTGEIKRRLSAATLSAGQWNQKGDVHSLAYTSDGSLLLGGGDDARLHGWGPKSGKAVFSLKGHRTAVVSVCCSPGGNRWASMDNLGGLILWDGDSQKPIVEISAPVQPAGDLVFSPDGKQLLWGGVFGKLYHWNWQTEEKIEMAETPTLANLDALAFSPDGEWLAAGGKLNDVLLLQADTRKTVRTLKGPESGMSSLAFSPQGNLLAAGAQKIVLVWDTETGEEKFRLPADLMVRSVAFSPDGQRLAGGGSDGRARIWEAESGELVTECKKEHSAIFAVTFSPDGKTLVTGGAKL